MLGVKMYIPHGNWGQIKLPKPTNKGHVKQVLILTGDWGFHLSVKHNDVTIKPIIIGATFQSSKYMYTHRNLH